VMRASAQDRLPRRLHRPLVTAGGRTEALPVERMMEAAAGMSAAAAFWSETSPSTLFAFVVSFSP